MNQKLLKEKWLAEEAVAHIHGWDFSHIHGRYEEEEDLPWNYVTIVRQYMKLEHKLLDIDTGGGEFLLSLNHPYSNTSATEAYLPNVELCQRVLLPLGIDFYESNANQLPFKNCTFDLVINRHGNFNVQEIFRILKPNGIFITEQVGAENDREFVDMLLPGTNIPYPQLYLSKVVTQFKKEGFKILDGQEAFCPIRF